MNHKRGIPKRRRAGCLMCKPHKAKATRILQRYKPGDMKKLVAHRQDYGLEVPR